MPYKEIAKQIVDASLDAKKYIIMTTKDKPDPETVVRTVIDCIEDEIILIHPDLEGRLRL